VDEALSLQKELRAIHHLRKGQLFFLRHHGHSHEGLKVREELEEPLEIPFSLHPQVPVRPGNSPRPPSEANLVQSESMDQGLEVFHRSPDLLGRVPLYDPVQERDDL